MRLLDLICAAFVVAVPVALAAEQPFDACQLFTQADAQQAAGAPVQPPPENPRAKRPKVAPKVIPACMYSGTKDGKPVVANVQFHFTKSDAETLREFEDNRMRFQTKPLLIPGIDAAFWSGKSGEMNLRKGGTWVTVTVGPDKPAERDMETARKAAESLAKKL
jgi:hypothetical protein